jgi:hypothetical protein
MLFSYAQSCFFALKYSRLEHLSESELEMDGLVLDILVLALSSLNCRYSRCFFMLNYRLSRRRTTGERFERSELKIDSLLFIVLEAI